MKRNILKCEDCTWFRIKNCESANYGIPMWQTFECTRHYSHPYTARVYEGLCGTSAKDYVGIFQNG